MAGLFHMMSIRPVVATSNHRKTWAMTKQTMYAAVAKSPGGPEVLQLQEVPRPAPDRTEILVRGHAASVNPADWKTRAEGRDHTFPLVLGWDVAGVVEEVGAGVTWLRVGDEVLGMPM